MGPQEAVIKLEHPQENQGADLLKLRKQGPGDSLIQQVGGQPGTCFSKEFLAMLIPGPL